MKEWVRGCWDEEMGELTGFDGWRLANLATGKYAYSSGRQAVAGFYNPPMNIGAFRMRFQFSSCQIYRVTSDFRGVKGRRGNQAPMKDHANGERPGQLVPNFKAESDLPPPPCLLSSLLIANPRRIRRPSKTRWTPPLDALGYSDICNARFDGFDR